jgi:hypothetical protein
MDCAMAPLRVAISPVFATCPARLAVGGLIALAGVCLAGPATAAARPPLKTVSATTQVDGPTGTTASVTARCPRGTRAVSGGYEPSLMFHPNGSGTALLVNTSRRLGPRSWKVSAYQLGGGDQLSLTAIANCSRDLGRPMVRIKKRSVEAAQGNPNNPNPGNASAHCPHHFFPVAGGFHISINGRSTNPSDSPPVSMILGSRAVARSWAVTGARLDSGHSRLAAFAYCYPVRPIGRPKVKVIRPRTPVGIDELLTPRCPRGWYAVSGGYSARFPMGPGQGSSIPYSSSPQGARRWSFGAVAVNGVTAPFNGFTYCLPRS